MGRKITAGHPSSIALFLEAMRTVSMGSMSREWVKVALQEEKMEIEVF